MGPGRGWAAGSWGARWGPEDGGMGKVSPSEVHVPRGLEGVLHLAFLTHLLCALCLPEGWRRGGEGKRQRQRQTEVEIEI